MANPLTDIEDKKSQNDLGVMVARVYEGALEETGSSVKAWWITAAYCYGMFKGNLKDETEEPTND